MIVRLAVDVIVPDDQVEIVQNLVRVQPLVSLAIPAEPNSLPWSTGRIVGATLANPGG